MGTGSPPRASAFAALFGRQRPFLVCARVSARPDGHPSPLSFDREAGGLTHCRNRGVEPSARGGLAFVGRRRVLGTSLAGAGAPVLAGSFVPGRSAVIGSGAAAGNGRARDLVGVDSGHERAPARPGVSPDTKRHAPARVAWPPARRASGLLDLLSQQVGRPWQSLCSA
jgi:hypothetical protein